MAKIVKANHLYKNEPILKVHRYIVQIIKNGRTKFHYCVNRQEVRELKKCRKKCPLGAVIEVYKANHDFKESFFVSE